MTARREKVLVSAALLIIVLVVFVAVQRWNGADPVPPPPWLALRVDGLLPLVPGAVWPYLSWYAFPLVLLRAERRGFRRASAAVLVAYLACGALWIAIPAAMARPYLDSAARGLSSLALRAVYAIDPPSNLFPSFHAAMAAVMLRVPVGSRTARWAMRVWVPAIWVACLLTKQHYLLDVIGGVLVGLGAVSLVDRCPAALAQWGLSKRAPRFASCPETRAS